MSHRVRTTVLPVLCLVLLVSATTVPAGEDTTNYRLVYEFVGFGDLGGADRFETSVRPGKGGAFRGGARVAFPAMAAPATEPGGDEEAAEVVSAVSWATAGVKVRYSTEAFSDGTLHVWSQVEVTDVAREPRDPSDARSTEVTADVELAPGRTAVLYRSGSGSKGVRVIRLTLERAP